MATDTLEFKLVMRPAKMNFAVAHAHSDDGKRFVVSADELLTAFVELESTIRAQNAQANCEERKTKLDNLSRLK